ncbi:uncharacterized protein MELLADRAFT_116040 [Melampsora larici-populina 98AG31]|uniref:Uncharacterized protein n=1 Tax=Melampsora larici-populina (strain 98AG31 / pathotype 3-4-7) TaxID=747676 RepID=F4RH59_MELLP|nr:uncharacterized protein MELLADRAFT_116040 [Melampsora larici-populina 98AG31]EGG08139.1 hypothetical protein MELLADRAFT_116040 [Melampsora larici-populina 98AG31]
MNMPDPTQLEPTHCDVESQLDDDQNELRERTKQSRMTSNTSYSSHHLSRPESREQLRSGSNLSVLSGPKSISTRSSRAHLDQTSYDESEAYGNSSVRRKPKGAHGSVNSLSFADSHSSISTGGASRQSLAFELAAAMDPTETDQSSILDSLGLGDDDDEEEEIGYEEEEENEEEIGDYTMREEADEKEEVGSTTDQRRRKASMESHATRSSGWANASPGWHDGKGSDSSPGKSLINADRQLTPTRHTRKSSRSTILTTAPSPHKSLSFEMADEFAEEAQRNVENFDEGDSYESDSSDAEERARVVLEAGLVSTAHFLTILKQSNTDYNPPPAGLAPPSNAKETTSDRQPAVEKLISEIVRTMTESVRDREAQIRELKEIEVALSHTDRRALAEVDSLPMILQDIDFRTYIVGKKTGELNEDYSSADQNQPENELETLEEEHVSGDGQITPLAHRSSAQNLRLASEESFDLLGQEKRGDAGPQTTPMNHLNQLKLVTTSLINSLNIINEHTQVSRQTQTDVVRKLKGVRGLVTNWKADHESLEQSKDHIARWETELELHNQDNPSFGKVRGKFEVQIKLATEEAEKLLDEASERARTLLLPATIPA